MPCLIDLVDDGAGPEALALVDQDILQQLIDAALAEEGESERGWQLGVLLVDGANCAALHQQHFGVSGTTDVMSFPDGEINPENGRRLVGEVVVCPEVAWQVVPPGPQQRQRVAQELLLYILHGTLHCLGYDDIEEEDRRLMWQRQQELLAPWGIHIDDRETPAP